MKTHNNASVVRVDESLMTPQGGFASPRMEPHTVCPVSDTHAGFYPLSGKWGGSVMGKVGRNPAILKAIDELTEALEEMDARIDDVEARLESLASDVAFGKPADFIGRRRITTRRKAAR